MDVRNADRHRLSCEDRASVRRDGDRERPRPADGMLGGQLPFAERRVLSGLKLPPLRSASSTASTDGGSDDSDSPLTTAPASRAEQLDVQRVVAAPLVEAANHLRHAARAAAAAARAARPAPGGAPSVTRIDSGPRRVGGDRDRQRADHFLAAERPQQHFQRNRPAGARPRIVEPHPLQRRGLRFLARRRS